MFTFCRKKKSSQANDLIWKHQMNQEMRGGLGDLQVGVVRPFVGAVTSSMIDASTQLRGQGREFTSNCSNDSNDFAVFNDRIDNRIEKVKKVEGESDRYNVGRLRL